MPARPAVLAVALLLAVGVGVPMVIGALSGALFLPRNDDPDYRRIALHLYSTGRLELNGWNSMTLFGQVFFVQPFLWVARGASWAFTASTCVFAATGIVAGYSLARRVLSVPRATLAVLGIVLFPGFLENTTSFMTDVPAWSAAVVCLWLGAVALDRDGSRQRLWLGAAMAVGCFGFSIREFAVVAPVAVLLLFALSPQRRRRWFWIVAAATAIACLAIYFFARHLPGQHGGFDVGATDLSSLSIVGVRHGFATLALVISPVLGVAIASRWRRWRAVDVIVGLAAWLVFFRGPILDGLRAGIWPDVMVGNLIAVGGSLDTVALYGPRPLLFVDPSWQLLNAVALAASFILAGVCGGVSGAYLRSAVKGLRDGLGTRALWNPGAVSTATLLGVYAALYGTGMCAWSLIFHFSTFDRYLWPLALPLYIILLRPVARVPEAAAASLPATPIAPSRMPGRILRRSAAGVGAVLMTGIATTALVLLVNADAFDAASWQMGDRAVEHGTPANTVDAGLGWVVFHATGSGILHKPVPALGGMYDQWWPSFHMCAMVSTAPVTDPTLTLEQADLAAYRLLFFVGPSEPLYLYRVQGPGCP
jgi:hypothetical protein